LYEYVHIFISCRSPDLVVGSLSNGLQERNRWALGRATSGQAVLADALQEFVPVPWKLQQKRLVDDPFLI
jgi:hypothetical protein